MYDKRNWMGIIKTLNDANQYQKIHTMNRVQLLEDALTFTQIGDLDYGIAFQMLKYLKHEKEYTPWLAALGGIDPISKLTKRSPIHGMYQVRKQIYVSHLLICNPPECECVVCTIKI